MPFLGLVDVSGIQRFLFRSPELKIIAASSDKIEEMTQAGKLFDEVATQAGQSVRPIFLAGGNAAYTANTEEELQAVLRFVSRRLIEDGDGLEVVVSLVEYEDGQLARDYHKAVEELERRKLTQPRSAEFRPAGFAPPLGSISANPKLQYSGGLTEPLNFKNMICQSEEKTDLMAVVSVDGLGMGKRLIAWMQKQQTGGVTDEDFICEFKRWSHGIKRRWDDAWKQTQREIERRFGPSNHLDHPALDNSPGQPRCISLQTASEGRRNFIYLPCRKIYQGGDDLSFVCDARIALSLVTVLISHLEKPQEDVPEEFREMTVSVGVLYVDSHFPFARAVRLADDVRANAKKRSAEAQKSERMPFLPSTLDWWVNRQGDMERPASLFEGATSKPYLIHARTAPAETVSWETLHQEILPGLWKVFGESRNKFKDLLGALEEGEEGAGVRQLLQLRPLNTARPFGFMGKDFDPESGFTVAGKIKSTPLLDAGELFDIHFPFYDAPLTEGA